ncbi:hypothetical protein SAMN05421833_123101 [Microbispora rosea]|uniref:Uncharacterized protein n=1 Tax=Microbispora rosea TaxID=58117 RepID=A0A1N7FQU7_9ACTN|nr:hypothetical protein [Microbispora rosea]GIH50810.1 hypothetical protein Mro03_59890 [Microbispora rosea subsp. rosea]SIS02625.1 hypothetical protein SAMN05421833_123101 [Microbispora rosea]
MLLAALLLVVAADAYFVVTTLADLFPFNNVREAKRSEKLTEVTVNAPVLALPALLLVWASAAGLPVLAYAAAAVELLALLGGLALWWLPYLAGVTVPWATAGTGETWAALHARTYAKTVIVLPRRGDRPRPNLEHMILHTLMLLATVCAFAAARAI